MHRSCTVLLSVRQFSGAVSTLKSPEHHYRNLRSSSQPSSLPSILRWQRFLIALSEFFPRSCSLSMATRERSGAYADYAYESPPSPRVKTYDENSRRPETESRPFYAGGEYRTFEEQERWEERQRYENALQIPEPAIDRHRSRSAQYERRQAPESEFIIRQESRKARHYSDEPKDKYQNKPGSSSLEFSFESFPDSEFVIRQKPRTPQQGYPDEASARLRNSTPAASPSVDDRFEELNIEEDAVTSSDSSSVEDREDIQSKCSKCIELLRSASRNLRQSSDQHVRPAVDDIARFARRLDDQAFYLEIWVREAGLSALPDDANDWESVAFARTVLTRLHKRAKKLADSGKKCAQPSEWSFNGPSNKSIENDLSDDENGSLP